MASTSSVPDPQSSLFDDPYIHEIPTLHYTKPSNSLGSDRLPINSTISTQHDVLTSTQSVIRATTPVHLPLDLPSMESHGAHLKETASASELPDPLTYPPIRSEPRKTAIDAGQAASYRLKARTHFVSLCFALFVEGWNDGSTGPLLPAIQNYYRVGFGVISLLFVLSCMGFITGAIMNVWLSDKLGFGKLLVLGSVCQVVAYAAQSAAGPYPLMITANAIAGFGIALQNAQANGFVGGLKENIPMKLGILHASYGLGAFAAPLLATHFAQTRHWSFHYFISLGLAVINTIVLIAAFRFKVQDDIYAEQGIEPGETGNLERSKYRQILSIKTVHYLALFALLYVGVEVTIGGWIVTFIIKERGGGSKAGYISSGFFGGLTIGRLGLLWLTKKIGEQRVIFLYVLLAITLEVTIWTVPSMIENAVAVSLIGLVFGPMYPIMVNYTAKVLPQWLVTGSVGWIAGIGQAGSAILPFLTGVIASRFGIGSLQPLLVAVMCIMVGVWALVPKVQRRPD